MLATIDIKVTRAANSKLKEIDFDNLPFGKNFTDHMLEADYINGEWKNVEIKPYQPLLIAPSNAALHYGQAIFEGIKAYKDDQDNAYIFRPYDNFKRFNISAERMQMPVVPEEIFIEGMRKLIEMDRDWIPAKPNYSLYIRPFMYASDEVIGVKASDTYKFIIILSPTGPYYAAPMRIWVEEKYIRAAEGGVGYAKAAGNYGGAMYVTAQAKKNGFDQVLWMDAKEHKYVQECGVMNVFFIVGDKVLTPDLTAGTILAGVTRDTVITVLKEMGFTIEERPVSIDEIIAAHKAGTLKEVFGTGTAATVATIKEMQYKDYNMQFDISNLATTTEVKKRVDDIRYGHAADVHGWMYRV
ncbi:MAG: branched-chain amino acid aminotransferase [Sphingobacteriales bacterium]|nr:MAG: branched-chain amino acid aminotransferase [Sphingobacteriales bacterium]